MKNKFRDIEKGLMVIFSILSVRAVVAQRVIVPVIKAKSNVVDIRDGNDFQKGKWNISPEVKPDIYNVERFKGSKRVAFYTDSDSISFTVESDKTYSFIILLNNKDSAYTQISTVSAPILSYKRNCTGCSGTTDTIPFTVGWNSSIRLKGKINNSDLLDMIFDTGANGVVLSDDAYSKNVKVKIDGSIQGVGIGGSSQDELSKSNDVEIAGLTWNHVPLSVKHQGKPNTDVVIGYNVFDGKVVEIDYDRKILVIHTSLPLKVKEYTKYDLIFRAGLSYIRLALVNGQKKMEGLFVFDTGSSETMFINNEFASANNLYSAMQKVGSDKLKGGGPNKIAVDKVLLPALLIGGTELKNVRIGIENALANDGPQFKVVGNDILKRFNAIIDYQNDVVYLMPNSLLHDYYLSQKVSYVIWSGASLLLLLIITVIIYYKKRRIKKSNLSIE